MLPGLYEDRRYSAHFFPPFFPPQFAASLSLPPLRSIQSFENLSKELANFDSVLKLKEMNLGVYILSDLEFLDEVIRVLVK